MSRGGRCSTRGWRVWLAAACAVFVLAQSHAAGPRVAVVVGSDGKAADWQPLITAGLLAERPATELVERGELARVWAERERAALAAKPEAGLAASAVATVDRYLHFRPVGDDRWIVELVDAASGRALGSVSADAGSPDQAGRLAKAAAGLLDAPAPAEKPRAVTVAVVESAGAAGDAGLFGLAVRLRAALADSGLTVLDRALTQELAVERNDSKRGFRASEAGGDFLGADYLVELSPDDIRLVRTADGVVAAARPRGEHDEVDALQQWLFPLMAGRSFKPVPYLPSVEIEALVPFYRGVALFDAGRFEDATTEFSRAYQLNDRFRDAYEWEARCYEALGMDPLAAAVRRFVAMGLLENLNSASGRVSEGEGLAFLGVDAADERDGAIGRRLSALAASALARRADLRLHIPEQLGRLVREYDWMSGAGPESGRGWEQAPDLFRRMALSGRVEQTAEGRGIRWTKRDVLTGRVVAEKFLALGGESGAWPGLLRDFLKNWPRMDAAGDVPASRRREPAGPASVREIQERVDELAKASGHEGNAARLKLALIAPEHPLVAGRVFVKGQDKVSDGIDAFLEHAMQEWLIPRIPQGDETRRWLELARLHTYLDYSQAGKRYSGRGIDTMEELRRFIAFSGEDRPGLVARYSWLYERQAQMPPAELAAECATLQQDLAKAPAGWLPEGERFGKTLEMLRWVSATAAGEANVPGMASSYVPTRMRVIWDANAKLTLKMEGTNFRMWHLNLLPAAKRADEFKALLMLNGQGRISGKFDREWMRKFLRSLVVANYIANQFWDRGRHENMPVARPFDWDAQAALNREQIEYFVDTIESYLPLVGSAEEMTSIHWVITVFISALNDLDFLEFVSDEDYAAIHRRLAKPFGEAAARYAFAPKVNSRAVAWQAITREVGRAEMKDHLRPQHSWLIDKPAIQKELEDLEKDPAVFPPDPTGNGFKPVAWWTRLRRWEMDKRLTATEHADYYLRHTADVLRWFEKREPSAGELPLLFEHALKLFYGSRDVEAEQVFRRVLAVQPGRIDAKQLDAYQANAALRLAQLLRQAGRLPEAMEMAGYGLTLDNRSGPHLFITQRHNYVWNKKDLSACLLRLLREMRNDPAKAILPARVGVVSIPTPNGDNPLLHVFYRTPPPRAGETGPFRVLVLAPVHNTEALDYLRDDSDWARFADEQGWVLVVPQFYVSDHSFRIDHRFSHVRYAQVWSGDALLRALDRIGRTTSLEKARLLLHGIASGSGFVCNFAAWRPDLVAAVSVNNGNFGMPRFRTDGLRPLGAQRHVRYFMTASEADNFDSGGYPRYDTAVDFVTRLRGAGVPVEWRSWPDAPHLPTREMEDAARAFLRQQSPR